MYWLQPPSTLRRLAAVLLVVGAVAWDLRSSASDPYPVASAPIAAGTPITADLVGSIDLPVGALPPTDPIGARAAVDVGAGEPLIPSLLASGVVVPEGWWTVPVAIGTTAAPGDEALLVVADPPLSVIGLVIEAQVGDPYDLGHRPASVAVPAEAAPLVAAAEHQGLLVAAIRSTADGL